MSGRDAPHWLIRVGAPNSDLQRLGPEHGITDVTYTDEDSKPDKLAITVDNYDLRHLDSPVWRHGNLIEVTWGYPGWMAPARECVIDKVVGSRSLKIEATDKGLLMKKKARTRTFENMTRSDIARAIAGAYGYGPDRQWIEDTEEVIEKVVQARRSDAEFLRSLANAEGFDYFVDYDGFHYHRKALKQTPMITLWYYNDPGVGEIMDWDLANDITKDKPGRIRVKGIDLKTKQPIDVVADHTTVQHTRLAPNALIVGEDDGTTAGDPVAEQSSMEVILPTTQVREALARRYAHGLFQQVQLSAVELKLRVIGIPNLVAKSVITVLGISPTLSGNYYVSKVSHKIKAPYTMEIECKRDGKNAISNPKIALLPGQGTGVKVSMETNTTQGAPPAPSSPQSVQTTDPETGQPTTKFVVTPRDIRI